jgi:hypothetical protein
MQSWIARFLMGLRSLLVRAAYAFLPPQMIVLEGAFGMARTRLLEAACELDVASVLEKNSRGQGQGHGMTARELAAIVKAHPDSLHRTLRALAVMGVFSLDRRGRFRNNAVSRTLIPGKPGSMHAFVRYFASPSNSRAWAAFPSTVATGRNAFERENGQGIWDYLAAHPEEESLFGAAMKGLTEMNAPAIAAGYDFSGFKRICDVAGGSGVLVSAILARNPSLEAVIFDSAREPELGIEPRVRRISGSFFETIPPGSDAYLMKDILHDWDDVRSLQILKTCRKSMEPGAKLLIIEMLLEPNQLDPAAATSDIQMMTVCNEGRQRSREEMKYLLANSGFSLERVIGIPSPYSIVEAIAR